ncbi:hypothetical protein K437DRAFT_258408 [Tilletiaria anomala UBC 951]|uniref:Uncharacterized protein n=1 Tax=Tilletiaria anomala (strain ATCC 24038 / CBS 436.72 / UBC 951) TaxID=1037660 RepID=A0A066VHT0_TILAU|nr:uncharacterized protein K437DRAFT_258408 [Tilletiaria anomala UBC 951]KDN41056.1 hypothetical protein K437DRAFT_258408 [Tilletiaria anomala UBC 951]
MFAYGCKPGTSHHARKTRALVDLLVLVEFHHLSPTAVSNILDRHTVGLKKWYS